VQREWVLNDQPCAPSFTPQPRDAASAFFFLFRFFFHSSLLPKTSDSFSLTQQEVMTTQFACSQVRIFVYCHVTFFPTQALLYFSSVIIRHIIHVTGQAGAQRRAWRLTAGDVSRLHLQTDRLPPPGPGEVTIRVKSIGLNFADVFSCLGLLCLTSLACGNLKSVSGLYSATPKGEYTPGLEFSGVPICFLYLATFY
jgi:hypothetical protein